MRKEGILLKLTQMLIITIMFIGMTMPENICYATEKQDEIMRQIDAAKVELEEAEYRQVAAVAEYNRGSLGFIEWMLAKTNLTEAQKKRPDKCQRMYY